MLLKPYLLIITVFQRSQPLFFLDNIVAMHLLLLFLCWSKHRLPEIHFHWIDRSINLCYLIMNGQKFHGPRDLRFWAKGLTHSLVQNCYGYFFHLLSVHSWFDKVLLYKENDLIQRAKVHREDWSMELEKSWIGFLYGNCDFAKITTCPQTISLWLLNSDDAFTAAHKDEINAFYDHLNK